MTHLTSIVKDSNFDKQLSYLRGKYVVFPPDKAPNIIVLYVNHITYTPFTKDEIMDNHNFCVCSFDISTKDGVQDHPSLY
jgi:hypothetical protein